jgi:hypothetical protein
MHPVRKSASADECRHRIEQIGERTVNDEKPAESKESPAKKDASGDSSPEQSAEGSAQSGPTFTESPDPLGGLKKTSDDLLASMEGKTVSMKVYVGTIIGVVVLMMLARCGG